MTRLDLIARLRRIRACKPSILWLGSLTCESAEECWASCQRSDWMYWLLCKINVAAPETTWRELACLSAERVAEVGESWFRTHRPEHAGAITEAIAAARSGDAAGMRAARVRAARADAAAAAAWAAAAAAAAADADADQAAEAAAAADAYAYAAADADAYADADAARAAQARDLARLIPWASVEDAL